MVRRGFKMRPVCSDYSNVLHFYWTECRKAEGRQRERDREREGETHMVKWLQ